MSTHKNQHYIPRFYLKGFADECNLKKYEKDTDSIPLWIYDKITKLLKQKGIKNICTENYYYSIFEEKQVNNDLENYLSFIEFDFNKTINKIKNNINILKKNKLPEKLSQYERSIISKYIVWQLLRVPKMVESIKNLSKNKFIQLNKEYNVIQSETELKKELHSYSNKALKEADNSLLHELVLNRIWYFTIINNTNTSFITSDNPILITNKNRNSALIFEDTEIDFPINKNIIISLLGFGSHEKYCKISDKKSIRYFNCSQGKNSNRYIIGRSKEQLESIIKFI